MTPEQKIYRQLLGLIPDLAEWTEKAARFDGSAAEALKFEAEGYMDLNVDVLQRDEKSCEIALSHYYKHETGDMIPDPDMQICVDFELETASARTYQDHHIYQEVEVGEATSLNRFLTTWLTNINQQGFELQTEMTKSQSLEPEM